MIKSQVAKYIATSCNDLSVDQVRTKISLLFGYYAGMQMSTVASDGVADSFTALFTSQWAPFESMMVALNEVRPVDFELAKSTASTVLVARARLNKGGLTNLFLPTNSLDVLDIVSTTQKLLGTPVSVQDVTLFFTLMDTLAPAQ